MPDGINFDKSLAEKIYLVIGESSCAEYYSLYGYPVKTTPFLDSLKTNAPERIFHYPAHAPAVVTRDALRLELSFASPLDIDSFFTKKNIINIANDSGFETLWISCQTKGGMYDTYVGMIASQSHYSGFEQSSNQEDLDLVEILKTKYKPNKKQFFALHINGSHREYHLRYDSLDIKALPGKGVVKDYERSIHHTDRLLKEIYNIMENDTVPSVLYYLSDHGEIIEKGHGFMDDNPSQFNVPLIVINKSSIQIDSVFRKYIDPELSSINAQNTIYLLSEILGYEVNDKNREEAIKAGKYIYHVNGKVYLYSQLLKDQKEK